MNAFLTFSVVYCTILPKVLVPFFLILFFYFIISFFVIPNKLRYGIVLIVKQQKHKIWGISAGFRGVFCFS